MKIYSTLSRQKEEFQPQGEEVNYLCLAVSRLMLNRTSGTP